MTRKPKPTARAHTAVRLSPEALARVDELAEKETEGNTSAMLRKLLSEALRARDGRTPVQSSAPARDLVSEPAEDNP